MKKIVVIKIGSSVLLTDRNRIDEYRVNQIATQVSHLKHMGLGVVLIISGAVGLGSNFIDINDKNHIKKRAAAGIGQVLLTSSFNTIFQYKNLQVAQVLLTKSDSDLQEISCVLQHYIDNGFIPLINENDVVDLNSFSGNDFLGAQITTLLKGDKFLMLSTMKGSIYGVGGGEAKQVVIKLLKKQGIETQIVNGKLKNILLKTIL
ncbi:hypothetical protein COV87_02110 [Candidatus Roizmanbacteria bacterium CG11_big_fil_rev_8_21_14_0_20_37_16]|uniref:Aspartate/glutamate/uridylate kinase domain-containing protein n=1 Tax=Candidatus Roizmanbacteria bacterium CG11_big_fil_rev_8_21_14_0_20_37_16 TaxID=1974857 RepID=A0A2H0KMP0_9BACT|nr:MAG: hypothetical protein COV87_02110 [Candidatus Roizmanbacteria bacterium CG11_big_fil_rev_8_21_14_0_20_37_16]